MGSAPGRQPRLVIEVQFPSLLAIHTERLEGFGPYKPGQAAARDWATTFEELFDGAVDLKPEHGTLQVRLVCTSCNLHTARNHCVCV